MRLGPSPSTVSPHSAILSTEQSRTESLYVRVTSLRLHHKLNQLDHRGSKLSLVVFIVSALFCFVVVVVLGRGWVFVGGGCVVVCFILGDTYLFVCMFVTNITVLHH